MHSSFDLELQLYSQGHTYVGGMDEVGRGPLAGPVVSCVIVFGKDTKLIEGVNDSKKVSFKNREKLYDQIVSSCLGYGIGIVDSQGIDTINIRNATQLSMQFALKDLNTKYNIQPSFVIADGGINILSEVPMKSIVKGDSLHYSISCASIVAKVIRDRMMIEYSKVYPEYGFEKHMGYGTKKHIEAIYTYGITPIHRKSFEPISSLIAQGV